MSEPVCEICGGKIYGPDHDYYCFIKDEPAMSEHEDLIARLRAVAESMTTDQPATRADVHVTAKLAADALAHAATRERIIEKWAKRADHGYDPEMADDVVAYWRGVRAVTDDIAQAYARYQQQARP